MTFVSGRTHGIIGFDTNGEDGSNVYGKDQFVVLLSENGIKYSD